MYNEQKNINFCRYEMHLISQRLEFMKISDVDALVGSWVGITRKALIEELLQLEKMEKIIEKENTVRVTRSVG